MSRIATAPPLVFLGILPRELGRPEGSVAALAGPARTLLVADCTEPWAFGPVYTDVQGARWSHIAHANGPPVHAPATIFNGGRSVR